MSTGWKWIRDDGQEFKSQRDAMLSLADRPRSRFVFSELTMAGTKETDVTDEFRRAFALTRVPKETCMCDTIEEGWRPCPESPCERPDHSHGRESS